MSGKIEISRELSESEFSAFWEQNKLDLLERKIGRSDCKAIWLEARKLAAPVVERQDPVYQVRSHGSCCWEDISGESLYVCAAQPEEYEIRKLYTSPPAPVAADIAHDRAYRNGMMAGFQFGISGNEKGYALAIANFNSEIHAAKGEPPAPVAVVLPERREPTPENPYLTDADHEWNSCLDKVKELNQ